MDFKLNEVQRGWQLKARKFAQEVIKPMSVAHDAIEDPRETFDWDVIKKGSKLGFRTMSVPKEYGGEGTDYVTQAVVMIELARADSAVGKTFSQNWKWSHVMLASCSEEQKKRFLTEFVKDDTYLLGKGITEPNAGNDNRLPPADAPKSGSRLKAERHGDYWILNGEKCFIANGGVAKLLFVDTRTDPNAPIKTGMTVFLIPTESTPGFRYGTRYNKTGWRFYQNAELIFDNARVPDANRVGEVNIGIKKGTDDTTGGDMFGDLELCSHGLGVCQNVVDRSMQHAKTVMRGGKPLVEQQWVQLKLHRMFMLTEALKSFTMRSAWEHDANVHSQRPGLNMNFACDTINEVTRLGIDIVGYGGGRVNAEADKLSRDALTWVHLGGDSVLRMRYARRIISAYKGSDWDA